jgi:UDP:flavonoid glycosyltransferase YjiC (YdhE family)
MVLWSYLDQPVWADGVTRLRVGTGRGFFESTFDTLVADLRDVLDSQCLARARDVAAQLTPATESVTHAADLLEDVARRGREG